MNVVVRNETHRYKGRGIASRQPEIDAAIYRTAVKLPELTSDDVLAELERAQLSINLWALGQHMRWAGIEQRVIVSTGKMCRSTRREKKGNLHTIWRSLVYQASGPLILPMPEGWTCQEASTLSFNTYIPCGRVAEAIVYHERDRRGYAMCGACASHNVFNRGGRWVTGTPETEYMRDREGKS